MFLDHVQLEVLAGHGGAGATSFRREKFAEHGGPDGGDGGEGGSVFIKANRSLNTLNPFRSVRRYEAQRGQTGAGSMCHGSNGDSIVLDVPLGTQIRDTDTGELLLEMLVDGDKLCVARGGR